jgi:hypothetical protein
LEWEKDTAVQIDDLWSLPDYKDSPLPQKELIYPIVDRQDANVVHFALYEDDKTWMITVNLTKRSLISYDLYKNAKDHILFFCNRKRICSDVCKFLSTAGGN